MDKPYFPFYVSDWLTGEKVSYLNYEQKGIYIEILARLWRSDNCRLPDDDVKLAGILNLHKTKWKNVKPILCDPDFGVLTINGGYLYNERLTNEHETLCKKFANRSRGQKNKGQQNKDKSLNCKEDTPQIENKLDPSYTTKMAHNQNQNQNQNQKENREGAKAPSRPRGTRLPDDWSLPAEWGNWAIEQGMAKMAVISEAHKFRDFWIAKTGAGATKLDWFATWRNWIRRTLENRGGRNGPNSSDPNDTGWADEL